MLRLLRFFASAFVIGWCIGAAASAQDYENLSEQQLRAEQARLFAFMFENPSNLDAMYAHATVSIRLRDYEAAISTLERLLIFEQNLPRVRTELGVAYFNLGSYEVARLYFNQVLSDPAVAQEVKDRVAQYVGEIDRRSKKSTFSLVANLGITYSTNANLAPQDNNVIIGGQPGFILAPANREQDDFGARWLVFGRHSLDLGRPNTDAWLTDLSVFGIQYFDVTDGNTFFTRLRTGPRLSLNDQLSGPKIRPYVEGSYLNGGDRTVYFAGFGGAELTAPIVEKWSFFADLNAGYFDYEKARNLEDRAGFRSLAGVSFAPDSNSIVRFGGLAEYYDADASFNSSFEIGARLSGQLRYDSGIEFVDSKWSVLGYADVRYRWYDDPDPFIDPSREREDVDFRAGLSHIFPIRDNFGFQLDLEGFLRDSNIRNFDVDNLSVTLSAQYRM